MMSELFGRGRDWLLGKAPPDTMLPGSPRYASVGNGGKRGSSPPNSAEPDSDMLPRPTLQDGRQASNNMTQPDSSISGGCFSFPLRPAKDGRNINGDSGIIRLYKPPVWPGRQLADRATYRARNRQMHRFHTNRCLFILLIAITTTVDFCACLGNPPGNTQSARRANHVTNNNKDKHLTIRSHSDSDGLSNLTLGTAPTDNRHLESNGGLPCKPEIIKSEIMSGSSTAQPTIRSAIHINPLLMPSQKDTEIDRFKLLAPEMVSSKDSTIAAAATKSIELPARQVSTTDSSHEDFNVPVHQQLDQLGAQSTQLVPSTMSRELLPMSAASGHSLEPLVVSASKKKKKMMKKKKKMEKKHKEWKKGKKHKKKKYESKKKKGGSSKKKKGKKEKKKWGMEKKGHKKKGNFKKKKWGHKKKMKKGHKKGKKGHKMLKDKGHKKKGFKKVYHKEEWGKKKKWHDIKREKKWNTKQKKWKKKWHQEKGKKYKGKHMKKYHKKNKHGKKYKKEKKSKWKKHKGEKFKKGHKKKKEEYSKKKEGGKKKKMKKEMKKMKKKKG